VYRRLHREWTGLKKCGQQIEGRIESRDELSRERSLSAQAIALALGSGAAQVLVAVLYILTARSMQPVEYGLVVTAIALGMFGAGLVEIGGNSYWVRELASGRITQEQLNPKMATRLLIAFTVAAVVIVVAAFTKPHFIATGVLLLSSMTVAMVLVPLRAARRAELVGLLTVLDRCVAIVAFFLQIALGVEAGLALWTSIAIGDLFVVIYVGISERSRLRLSSRALSNPYAGTKWYSLTAMSSNAQSLDLPILAALAGAGAAGIYGGVNRWGQPMSLATASFVSAVMPFLAAQGDLRALRSSILRASWMLVIVIVLNVGVIITAPWLVTLLLGDAYASSAAVLQWLAGSAILNTIAQPLIVTLMARQFDHLAAIILVVSVGAQLATVAFLAPTLGALGASMGVFLAQALQIVASLCFIAVIVWRRRHLPGERI
jgi:O-antigen/teichoic acid export membrane protein